MVCAGAPDISRTLVEQIKAAAGAGERKTEAMQEAYATVLRMVREQTQLLTDLFRRTEKFEDISARHTEAGTEVRSADAIKEDYVRELQAAHVGPKNAAEFATYLAKHDRRFLKASVVANDPNLWTEIQVINSPTRPANTDFDFELDATVQ